MHPDEVLLNIHFLSLDFRLVLTHHLYLRDAAVSRSPDCEVFKVND